MSSASRNAPSPSPDLFFRTVNAYQQTEAIKAAVELELFTAIAEGNSTAPDLARRCKATEKGVRVLCDYLTIHGFLEKREGRYELTPDSAAFLDKRSSKYAGGAIGFLLSPAQRQAYENLAGVVRKGGTLMKGLGSVEPENPIWQDFARSMVPLMAPAAEGIAEALGLGDRKVKVLDIAAGHGLFGITIARRNPNAEIFAVDWDAVLAIATEHAQAAGVIQRYHIIPGSAFEVEFGTGYDVALLTNFLHHFDVATNETLLRKINAALKPGGVVATLEFIPNEDRVTPPVPAAFALMMLGGTAHGDAYVFSEYETMFRNAGFSRNEMREMPPTPQRLILSWK